MKIAQSNDNSKPTNIKSWLVFLITGPFRWVLLLILVGISAAAGFLYSLKFHPRTEISTFVEPEPTPTTIAPLMATQAQEEIAPLPVIQLTVDEGQFLDESSMEVSGELTINNGNSQSVQFGYSSSASFSDFSITLSEENAELLLNGKVFQFIQAPADQAVSVWIYARQLRHAGIAVVDFVPAIVSINGNADAVYYMVQIGQSQQNTYFQLPEPFFSVRKEDKQQQRMVLDEVSASVYEFQNEVPEERQNQLLTVLSNLMKYPDEQADAFDMAKFAEYFAIHDLWAASYDSKSADPVYAYNWQTNLIQPAVVNPTSIMLSGDEAESSFPFSNHPLYAFSNLQIAYLSTLIQESSAESFQTLNKEELAVFQSYDTQISELSGSEPANTFALLNFRYQMMRLQVNPPYPVRGFVYADGSNDCVNIDIVNLMVVPVDVVSVNLMGVEIPLHSEWLQNPDGMAAITNSDGILGLKPYTQPDTFMNFCVPVVVFEEILTAQNSNDSLAEAILKESTWMINTRLSGQVKMFSTAMVPDVPAIASSVNRDMPPLQSIEQITSEFPFIIFDKPSSKLTFLRGTWQIPSDIVIPAGLKVVFEPGCELYFAPDAVLLSFSPFQANGTERQPVIFSAEQDTWPGMIVIDAGSESVLEHVVVEKTAGIERGGWILTGGITFYRSPVIVKNSTFQDSFVEDAINVIRTTFTFDQLTIQRTPSDAFDSDFADGTIVNCHFEDIGGDAVDISGARVDVLDTTMLNITDKGLSAGEDSHMAAENLIMNNMGIGGAAKDLSTLVITDSTIQNARVAGLTAYIKKSIFGPSSVEATNVQILDTATETLVQTGSSVIWNGKEQRTQELNVKTLYALGILGN
jgi:hypothetical protein